MTVMSLATLLLRQTKAQIYETGLAIAEAVGLPVSTWHPGDPTRSQFHLEAELLEKLDGLVADFIASGFLDWATGAWLKILAEQVYNVTVDPPTYASTTVVLTNGGGAFFDEEELAPGLLTFRSSLTGKTYTNVTGGALASGAGQTLAVTVVADEPGSDSSAGAGEIDEMVTTLLGVTCSNPTAAVGVDEQSEETTRQQCRDKLGALSPNGPKEAYAFVARSRALSGTGAVTDVRVYPDSDTGDVTVYLRGPSGPVPETDRALVEAAILKWATPLCITPTVFVAAPVAVPVAYELWIYKSVNRTADEIREGVEAALEQLFATRKIGGDVLTPNTLGRLSQSLVASTIRNVYPQAFRVHVASPSEDVILDRGQVAVLGAVIGTIHLVVDP